MKDRQVSLLHALSTRSGKRGDSAIWNKTRGIRMELAILRARLGERAGEMERVQLVGNSQ